MRFNNISRFLIGVWILITVNFFLLRLLPGSPLERTESLHPSVDQRWISDLKLNESQLNQYFFYLKNMVKGDLGPTLTFPGLNASEVIRSHTAVTLTLNLFALALVFLISGILVWTSFQGADSWITKIAYGFSLVVNSAPSILLGPIIILIFSVWLNWLPSAFLATPLHYILPAFVLALRPAVYLSRSLGVLMSEELKKDYVRTARSKGLSHNKIVFVHILKNSIAPVLGLLPPIVVGLLSGSAFIEIIFAVPGLGSLFIESLNQRDYFLSSALVLVFGTLLMAMSGICDWTARQVDPRLGDAR